MPLAWKRRTALAAITTLAATALAAAPASGGTFKDISNIKTTADDELWVDFSDVDPDHNPGETPVVDHAINAELVRLIKSVPNNGTITGTFYDIGDNSGVIQALREAKAAPRNITLRIIQHNTDDPNLSLPFDQGGLGPESVRRCARFGTAPSPCNGNDSRGIMHDKVMTFSAALDRESPAQLEQQVTWFGSHNAVAGRGGAESFNNSVTIYGDADIYNGTNTQIIDKMWNWNVAPNLVSAPSWGADFFRNSTDNTQDRGYYYSTKSHITVYASPELGKDHIAARLDGITVPDTGCKIHVQQNTIHRRADDDAVSELARLKQQIGCQVFVLVAWNEDTNTPRIDTSTETALTNAGISIRVSKAPLHDKIVLVNADYDNMTNNRYNIFTGSHNITASAQRENDELLVRIDRSPYAHSAFRDHFDRAWFSAGACTWRPTTKTCT